MKAGEANQEIAAYQAELAVTRISSLANSIGSLGTNSSVVTDVYMPPNMVYLQTVQSGSGAEIVLRVKTPEGEKDTTDIIKYPISNPGTVVNQTASGSWAKIKISSTYVNNQAQVRIEKV
jgi:hypothetical protein